MKNKELENKILRKRLDDIGFHKVTYLEPDKDTFPNEIDIVKWYKTDYSKADEQHEVCFTIGRLKYDEHEDWWKFSSIGIRYLEYGTGETDKWIIDFCSKYKVVDGELVEYRNDEDN